jgi:UDP-N-acetylglucosamine/UDP-N-acetylgalactosamine 4-epimerase
MDRYTQLEADLRASPRRFLVTGAGGFIGSHLVERLAALGQEVTALDNFSTGKRENIHEAVKAAAGAAAKALAGDTPAASSAAVTGGVGTVHLVEADLCDPAVAAAACAGQQIVLHQAALGSVPRSLKDPLATMRNNVDGTVNLFWAAHQARVSRVVYASSSSIYGDHPELPKVEDRVGRPLSPYALSKKIDEQYAELFGACYGMETIGLRYFNVFGRRQDPDGPYAAVIPRWIDALLAKQQVIINGDGETSRDFCHVENVVRANLLAALAPQGSPAVNQAYNVAVGERTTLNELFTRLRDLAAPYDPAVRAAAASHQPFRAGDVRHSLADISKARRLLGYEPVNTIGQGLVEAMPWYVARARSARSLKPA